MRVNSFRLSVLFWGLFAVPSQLLYAADVKIGAGVQPIDAMPSLITVLAAPASFDTKRIVLKGFFVRVEAGYALYLTHDDAAYGILTNAISVEVAGSVSKVASRLNGQFVLVEGVFEAKPVPGQYQGSLRDVSRVFGLTRLVK